MRLPLRLNDIEQEHLQELYDAGGVPRDDLPYTEVFDQICAGFQDRTFKNATPEQVYGALLKYVRSSRCATVSSPVGAELSQEHLATLRILPKRHVAAGKLLPYSDEFELVRKEFAQAVAQAELPQRDFWYALLQAQNKRRPARPAKTTQPAETASALPATAAVAEPAPSPAPASEEDTSEVASV